MDNELVSLEELHKYVVTYLLNDTSLTIAAEEDLLLSGFLDSLSVIRLVTYLEKQSTLPIPPEDITLENFGTLQRIYDFVNKDLKNRHQ